MVNKKPSTGCKNCRQRHVKCDERRPGCLACAARNISCPGYRDVQGVIFIDVSQQVKERQARLNAKNPPRLTQSPLPELAVNEDELAVIYFFTEHVLSQTRSLVGMVQFDHIIPLYLSSESTSALALGTKLVGRRMLAAHHKRFEAYCELECRAFRQLQKAVADPIERLKDETLLAVLCLDFAAHLSARHEACRAHIDGAVALVQYRTMAGSFSTSVAQSLYAATRSSVVLQALWSKDDMRSGKALVNLPKLDLGRMSPSMDLQHIAARVLLLEQTMVHQSPDEHLLVALALETELADWWQKKPPSWVSVISYPKPPHQSDEAIQTAATLCHWYCLKLVVLKHVYVSESSHTHGVPEKVRQALIDLAALLPGPGTCKFIGASDAEKLIDRNNVDSIVLGAGKMPVSVSGASWAQQRLLGVLMWVVSELDDLSLKGAVELASNNIEMTKQFQNLLQEMLTLVGGA